MYIIKEVNSSDPYPAFNNPLCFALLCNTSNSPLPTHTRGHVIFCLYCIDRAEIILNCKIVNLKINKIHYPSGLLYEYKSTTVYILPSG